MYINFGTTRRQCINTNLSTFCHMNKVYAQLDSNSECTVGPANCRILRGVPTLTVNGQLCQGLVFCGITLLQP